MLQPFIDALLDKQRSGMIEGFLTNQRCNQTAHNLAKAMLDEHE